MSCATPHPFLPRWKPASGGTIPVQSDRISLLACSQVHQKTGDLLPTFGFGFFQMETVRGGVGAKSPTGCSRFSVARKSNRIGAGLLQCPTLAAGPGFVQLVAISFQPGIHQQDSILSSVEPVALNHRDAALVVDGTLMPRFTRVGCDQEKRIAGNALQVCAGD